MSYLKIRHFQSSDLDDLLSLIDGNIPEYFAIEEKLYFEHYLSEEIEQYFVLEIEGQIVACGGINFFKEQKEARISWDIVAKQYQNKGVGAALLSYRLNLLKEMPQYKNVVVRTSQLVYKFYQKNGFVLKFIEKNFWAEGLDMYYMEMDN